MDHESTQGYRLLHAMIRVRDLDRSIGFYCDLLGMKVLRRKDYPEGKFTNTFVGYGSERDHAVIELTHNWGREEPYDLGTGFGHLAVGAPDIYGACDRLKEAGVKIARPPGPMKHGATVIAFIEDPDGYKIELIETGAANAASSAAPPPPRHGVSRRTRRRSSLRDQRPNGFDRHHHHPLAEWRQNEAAPLIEAHG